MTGEHDDRNLRTREPWVESPWFESDIEATDLPADVREIATQYHRDGYAVVRGLVDPSLAARIIDDLVQPLQDRGRIQDAWQRSAAVRELAVLPPVLDLLRTLYRREPVPFQTLNFEFGTQQLAHSDVVHFSTLPPRYMCGVWVALEDVDAGNGPLMYYPGSQRAADPTFQRFQLEPGLASYPDYEVAQGGLMRAMGIEPIEFHARAGDVLIWSANLVHGGRPITEDGRTRWSQVTHYFFDGCVFVTPLFSDPDVGEWYVRDGLVDIRTGAPAPQTLDGRPVRFEPTGTGRHRIVPADRTEAPSPRIAEFEAAVAHYRHAADASAADAAAVRSSHSYRIGQAVLAPARWLRRATSRAR